MRDRDFDYRAADLRSKLNSIHEAAQPPNDDGMRWLALLLLKVTVILGNEIRKRYGFSKGVECPRCGPRH